MTASARSLFALLFLVGGGVRADQVEMRNGDRYAGKVISMTADTVVLQSEVLGRVTLQLTNVAKVNVGAIATTTSPTPAPVHQAAVDTNLVEKIRKQFLDGAGPAANNKYDELVAGLLSGKSDISSLRAEARTAADQIRALKRQGDPGEPLDSYLAILDNFLKQSATSAVPSPPGTNGAPSTALVR